MKKIRFLILSTAIILMIFITGCNRKIKESNTQINDNIQSTEIQNEQRVDDIPSEDVHTRKESNAQGFIEKTTQYISTEYYKSQKIFRADFTAKTHVQVQDMKEYYSDMDNIGLFTYSNRISEKLCELIFLVR